MAAISGTALQNSAATGYVTADGFMGAPSTADINNQRQSTQPALAPNGLTGNVTASSASISVSLGVLGAMQWSGTSIAAAGTVIGNATVVPKTKIFVRASAAASTAGVKLTTIVTNRIQIIKAALTVGVKVYATGAQIDGGSTNAAITVASNKAVLFWCATPKLVYTFKGA